MIVLKRMAALYHYFHPFHGPAFIYTIIMQIQLQKQKQKKK